jgi:hypothetical protein
VKYLDGDLTPEDKIILEKEISSSEELQHQTRLLKTTLEKSGVLKEARIGDDYFINMIPKFRLKKNDRQIVVMNPAIAGGVLMILTFVLTLFFLDSKTINNVVSENVISDEFDQDEINSMLENLSYRNSEYDLIKSDEVNLDSLIERYISDDILSVSVGDKNTSQNINFYPDEIQISESEADNLYAEILNKKFF